ncbi:IS66 family transposase [Bathymodiolus platifrons methanotrophic gill symbiont]|uniref:IS66 family transposase n=1 Tax=Bathymodiolus platifrons methanotrophic gill symbiont TaxID=113268 RepID=UPI001C8D9B85|nr:transposase [Bathymodiolus platifrons methanotrophic gill symbiont]
MHWHQMTVILVGCMAHARRKFDEALKALPKESRKNKMGMAQTALRKFARLYALEKQFKGLTIEQRLFVASGKKQTSAGRFKTVV